MAAGVSIAKSGLLSRAVLSDSSRHQCSCSPHGLQTGSGYHPKVFYHYRNRRVCLQAETKALDWCSLLGVPTRSMLEGIPSFTRSRKRRQRFIQITSLDAAMPFDYEAIQREQLEAKSRLKIGIIGFGNFGQFLARRLVKDKQTVLAFSRSDYSAVAKELRVTFFRDADDFCEEHPDVVILATSILSTDRVLKGFPLQRLKRSTLFVDVLSVKAFPKALFLQVLPPQFDILCTHPMFGPESGAGSWAGLPFVYDRVRIGGGKHRAERCDRFLQIFAREGCRMVEMSCEEHDRYAAGSQFVTHTVGRVLGRLGLEPTPINTRGYETLLNLVQNTYNDSFDLYYGLFMYNINATEELQRLELAFDAVKKQLFDQLHDILRAQLFAQMTNGKPAAAAAAQQGSNPLLQALPLEAAREPVSSPRAGPPQPGPLLAPEDSSGSESDAVGAAAPVDEQPARK